MEIRNAACKSAESFASKYHLRVGLSIAQLG
jgi:hypothetical protein